MPPGGGRNTPANVVDGDVLPRRDHSRRIFTRRSGEKKNPGNLEFERQVDAYVARQEQRRQNQMSAFLYRVGLPYWNVLSASNNEDDGDSQIPWNDVFKLPGPSSAPLLLKAGTQQGKERFLNDSANKTPDTDFLEGTFIKINSDKPKATRNKKKNKKRCKGKCRKQSHALQTKSELSPTKPSSTCADDAASGEALVSSSSHVDVGAPLLDYSSPSSSPVTQTLINPAISGASAAAKELYSSSNDDFNSFDSTISYSTAASSSVNDCYTGSNAWNNTMGDYAGSMSDVRSVRPLSASQCINSRGFNKKNGGGNKTNDHRDGSRESSLCRDHGSNDGDFQKVIHRKAAQKMRRMQPLGSPTIAASGPIMTHALVPRTPWRQDITLGNYIKDDYCFHGGKPNHRTKGKKQKRPSLTNISKTGHTHGENVLVGGNTEHTYSAAPSSDKTSSLDHLANSSCVGRDEQKKAMAPIGGDSDTEDITDSTAPTFGKTSSLDHLANSLGVGREEQKKSRAPVGGGDDSDTKDTLAPSSDKTSSLDHLANSSCVDREEQKKAMALVGGDYDNDTKDTDSITPSSDKTSSSLGHLSNSSCVKREENKKEENQQSCTHASSELDKIIKAANDAYETQAASDAYLIYGVHADIETFLHSATPVIAQISCTTNNISLHDQCLWSVWRWYEEPECCGIEVEMQGSISSSYWANSSAYFVPSLSAVQLFGQSGNKFSKPEEPCLLSSNHGGLFFQYFESEMPYLRPPLFTKIKQLLNGVNLSGNPIFGDPKQLASVKLSDLHPASWFCVSWYPICQIPSSSSRSQAAFLTYHSLGKLVPQTCPTYMADGLHSIICPIVGLLGYRDQGEKWYELGEQRFKPTLNGSWKTHADELFNKKMRALRHCASTMSKAGVPRASGVAMNSHPDYKFFLSRSKY